MFKKVVWLLLLVTLIMVACGGDVEEEVDDTPIPEPAVTEAVAEDLAETEVTAGAEDDLEPVVVRFIVYDFEQPLYSDLTDAFEEENPDLQIQLVSVEETLDIGLGDEPPDDAVRRLVSAADASNHFFTQEAVEDDLLLDLGPFIEADPNFDVDDFQPGTLEYFQSGGGTWAVPSDTNYQLIYFNKDMFDAAGLDYPQPGWSWDDFVDTAKALTIREGEETTQWGFVEISPNPSAFIESQGNLIFDMTSDPPSADIDNAQIAEAMRRYTDLYLTHEVAPYFPEPEEEGSSLGIPEGYLVVEQGQAAMWPEASGTFTYRNQQMNIGVVPFPADAPDVANNLLYPGGLSISVGTANPEAAWRWVDFLSRQNIDLLAIYGGRSNLPARSSVAAATNFWDEVDEALAPALQFAVDHAYTSAAPSGGRQAINDAFDAIVTGEKSVEEALADAQIAAEEAISESLVEGEPDEEIVVEQGQAERPVNEDATTVEFVAVTGALEMQTFRDLANQFSDENPDVVIEIKQPNFFEGTPDIKDIAVEADCFQWFPGNFNDIENQDALLNVDPFLDADSTIEEGDFYPAVMDAFKNQGQTWGLPGQINITLIEYNKDLFDEAGVPYPTNDWTTEEFLAAAVALTQGEGETRTYGFVSDLFEPSDMLNMMDRLGAKLIDDSEDPPVLALDSPETIEAVRWYTGLTTEYDVKPVLMTSLTSPAVTAVQERQALIDEGRAGMWTNSAFNVVLGGEGDRDYSTGAVPLPTGSGAALGSGYQSTSGYFISADTEAREACWQWIKFLSEQPNAGIGMPSRVAVAESSDFRDEVGDELASAYLASMANASQPPLSQLISDQYSWLNYPIFWLYGAYDQIVNGDLGVEDALVNAQQLVDEYRACVIATEAYNDDQAQKDCMLQTDETLPAIIFGTE